jgi:hypothetical protein
MLLFCVITYFRDKLRLISKNDKGKHNQGKNSREIAEIARISFGNIGRILRRSRAGASTRGTSILTGLQAVL